MARVEWLMWNALSKCAIAPLRELPQRGERQKLKEGSQRTRCKKGGKKPWITRLPVYCKEGGGGIFCLATVRQLRPVQYSTQSAHGGGVLSSTESTPVLQGSHYIVFTIVCNWGKKKKEEGAKGGEGNLCLCAGKTQQESDLVIIWVCRHRRTFLPPSDSGATSSPEPSFAKRRSHIRPFSDRQTATPGLLLMMRADVRAGSMNIDVEDSLFHRRTERGKMAAL